MVEHLLKDNNCLDCDYYDCEANDHYIQTCFHPNVSEQKYLEESSPSADHLEHVSICPATGKSPYDEE